MTAIADDGETQILVLTPRGRDAALAEAMLRDGGVTGLVRPCAAVTALVDALDDETAFVIAAEEALANPDLRLLATWVGAQPPWSDLPFIILTQRGGGVERNPSAARLSELLGNVTFIERPFHPTTFVSLARTALRGRLRQFEARARLIALREGEERLRQANESLEHRVAERTEELRRAHAEVLVEIDQRQAAEAQLRQTQKVEAIGQITSGVAHDFNNLLLAVLANLDLLRRRVRGDMDAEPLIEGAIQAAQRGAALTQRLLAFARQQALQVRPMDVADLVRGMLDLVQRSLGPGIEVTLGLGSGLPPALVDVNQVELALLNLVVNARDAMDQGGRITITLDQGCPAADEELPQGDYLRLCVSDTGHGMDPETLRRAVDPFFSTKEPGKGTGLGLSMVDGLARQLHGALRLFSAPGEGTRAVLWLPAATTREVGLPPTAASPDLAPTPALRILFVEDEVIIALATRRMLVDLGHTVIDVRSGLKALEVIEGGAAIDLMITDFSMPKMTGLQLAERVRQLRPRLPILLATGYMTLPEGTSLDLPRLSKPYMQRELREMIESVVGRAAAPAPAEVRS